MGNAFFVFLVWGLLCSMVKEFCFLLAGRTGIIKIWNAVLRFVRGFALFCSLGDGIAVKC